MFCRVAADIGDPHVHRLGLAVALRGEFDGAADTNSLDLVGQIVEAVDRRAVHRDDDVARGAGLRIGTAQAGMLRRRAWRRAEQPDSAVEESSGSKTWREIQAALPTTATMPPRNI